MYDETVTVLTAATKTDDYTEDPEDDWSQPPATMQNVDGEVQPLSSDEAVLTSSTVVSRWRAYLDATAQDGTATVVTADNRLRFNGTDYEIVGKPDEWRVGGMVDHYEVLLKLVEG